MKNDFWLGMATGVVLSMAGMAISEARADDTGVVGYGDYGVIIEWPENEGWGDGQDFTKDERAGLEYHLFAAYSDTDYQTWFEVVRTPYLDHEFRFPQPDCVLTKVRAHLPATDSYSEFSDLTLTCIDSMHVVTNRFDYAPGKDYGREDD